MSTAQRVFRSFGRHRLAALLGMTAACGSGTTVGGPTGNPDGNASIGLTLSPAATTIRQGSTTSLTGTVTRSGGFTGVVDLTLSGAPSGVSFSVGSMSNSGTSSTSTVTIVVDASTSIGTYPLTITAAGTDVTSVSAAYTLTVAVAYP